MFGKALKKILFILITSIILYFSFMLFPQSSNAKEGSDRKWRGEYSDTTIIVKYKEDIGELKRRLAHMAYGTDEEDLIGPKRENVRTVRIRKGQTVEEVLEKYLNDPNVEYAEPNYTFSVDAEAPNDPKFQLRQADNFSYLNILEAWDYTTGSNDVIIAIVDTGINHLHEDLQGRIPAQGYDTRSKVVEPVTDLYGHGTRIAGVIAANVNNGIGIAGVTAQSQILPIKASDNISFNTSDIATGIRYAADNGAKVINLSVSSLSNSITINSAVDYAYGKGCVIVASSGNYGDVELEEERVTRYPAANPKVIGVGGVDHDNPTARHTSSSFGEGLDVMGVYNNHASTDFTGPAAYVENVAGTSYATPQVVGLAALLLSIDSTLGPEQVKQYIINGCTDLGETGWDVQTGWGRVNFQKSIELLIQDGPCISVTSELATGQSSIVRPGDTVTYTVKIENIGGILLSDVKVETSLDEVGSWTKLISTLEVGEIKTYDYTYTVPQTHSGGIMTNIVTVQCNEVEKKKSTVDVTVELVNAITIKYINKADPSTVLEIITVPNIPVGQTYRYTISQEYRANGVIWRTDNYGEKDHVVAKGTNEIIVEYINVVDEVEEKINSKYVVEIVDGINYIENMTEITTVAKVKQSLELISYYKIEITNINGELLSETQTIGTGSTIAIRNQSNEIIKSYKVVVKGDITGDGSVNYFDIIRLIKYVYEPEDGFTWEEPVRRAGKLRPYGTQPFYPDIIRLISYCYKGEDW